MRQRLAPLTVIKLGGSHALGPHVCSWLSALAACPGQVVIVPGGGPFADAVREAQPKMGFGDRAAHHMALLAMEQFGCAMIGLEPTFFPAATLAAIRSALRQPGVPVWLPSRMALAAPDLPASWDLTSDSLAAWLAGRLGATRILLVKHGVASTGRLRAPELAADDIVDPLFGHYAQESGAEAALVPPHDHTATAEAIRCGSAYGAAIEFT